jgi:hypothetical protein
MPVTYEQNVALSKSGTVTTPPFQTLLAANCSGDRYDCLLAICNNISLMPKSHILSL